MTIKINGDGTVPQPTTLLEELLQIQGENMSILGGVQRNRFGQKKQATLSYSYLSPSQYQALMSAFTSGSGISYFNDASNYAGGVMTFSGLPYFTESPYVQGTSLYREFQVKIREL